LVGVRPACPRPRPWPASRLSGARRAAAAFCDAGDLLDDPADLLDPGRGQLGIVSRPAARRICSVTPGLVDRRHRDVRAGRRRPLDGAGASGRRAGRIATRLPVGDPGHRVGVRSAAAAMNRSCYEGGVRP
jgi:hypothetical protein